MGEEKKSVAGSYWSALLAVIALGFSILSSLSALKSSAASERSAAIAAESLAFQKRYNEMRLLIQCQAMTFHSLPDELSKQLAILCITIFNDGPDTEVSDTFLEVRPVGKADDSENQRVVAHADGSMPRLVQRGRSFGGCLSMGDVANKRDGKGGTVVAVVVRTSKGEFIRQELDKPLELFPGIVKEFLPKGNP